MEQPENTASGEAGASVLSPPRENLYRIAQPDFELRESDGAVMPTLTGHFAVFDEWAEINSAYEGRFMERFAPTSMNKTITEGRGRMRVLYDHGHDPSIGNKVLGPIDVLESRDEGAYYEVPLFDTSYNRDLIPGLKAGVYGASFRFEVIREDITQKPGKSDHNPRGLPERTVLESRVREFGPVTFPAYPSATAGLRSITDEVIFQRFIDQPERLRELLLHFLPKGVVEEDDLEETAPTEDRAEPEAHPVVVRRDTRPLFGLDRKEKPSWLL